MKRKPKSKTTTGLTIAMLVCGVLVTCAAGLSGGEGNGTGRGGYASETFKPEGNGSGAGGYHEGNGTSGGGYAEGNGTGAGDYHEGNGSGGGGRSAS